MYSAGWGKGYTMGLPVVENKQMPSEK